ncbi:protein tyrosine phosphatase receptor type N L homeolog isoform X2 [Xenopus laevis]|uniref:Protein tyrosine phosphatase receptor type N L homeolog isoform X2 n=1 Tax=Xenopus laevis TaxID=8355 RepID=A0A8J0TT34_XENLA|nr:protein tyrosine phosphatase receptor type N L homeolog isoform X2 [Xenopus laevis]
MRLSAGLTLCFLLLSCRPLLSLSSRGHGCLFDVRLCSKEEVCVRDGLFGQCRPRAERDDPPYQMATGTLQQLQGVLQQLTAKGFSWKDDMTPRLMAHKMGRISQHRPLEPLDGLDEDRFPLSHASGRTMQRLSGASQPSTPRWASSSDKLQYFRPRLPSPLGDTSLQKPRLPLALRQDISPLVDQYMTYLLLSSQTPKSQFGYQESERPRNPPRVFSATHTLPDGSSRFLYGRYQEGQDGPSSLYLSSDRRHHLADLKRKLPRDSLDNSPAADILESSEGIEEVNQIPDGVQEPQADTKAEPARAMKGGAQNVQGAQMVPESPLLTEVQGLAGDLDRYRVDLRQLSDTQLEQLSSLLQFIQTSPLQNQGPRSAERSPSKRITEGEMQHMPEVEPQLPPPDTSPKTSAPSVLPSELGDLQGPQNQEGNGLTSAISIMLSKHPVPNAQTMGASEAVGQRTLEKKSYEGSTGLINIPVQSARPVTEEYGYIVTNQNVVGSALTFRIRQNNQNLSLMDVADRAVALKSDLETKTGVKIIQTGVGQRNNSNTFPHPSHFGDTFRFVLLIFIALACIAGIVIASAVIFCLRQHAKQREKERLVALGPEGGGDTTYEYQDLCRQHMAGKSLFSRTEVTGSAAENSRVSSVSSQFSDVPQPSPSSHSSTPSWCEEPVQSNMDISTGHMILAYMEDHLRNRDRLAKEWQALCAYQAEPNACSRAKNDTNLKKNRNPDYVPYDHARIKLRSETNPSRSDYINASPIIEHDPRMPTYIATQGPLSHTISDFWQMVWENGCTVIVMLSPLVEDGVKQCDRYWPDEGSSLYHIYEVNLVSEHIWCEDFLVRSFYLKNVQTQETRTLTQFHFLSWPAEGIPSSTRPLLDFRRKVNKSFRGRSCPIIVHCSDGAGRTGTYILVDMVLNRMAKGVKEIDIAATLEHVRDQRPGMVRTKDQFEFALTAVAEEVNAILKALPQ